MILSVFCVRLIRMVGPSATAAAAAPVVVTNSRRSIPFRLVMGSTLHSIMKCGVGCRVSGVWESRHQAPGTRHQSDRIHHTQGDLARVLLARRRPRRVGAEVLRTELVAARPEPQHARDILVLAPEVASQAGGLRVVRVVHAVEQPGAPMRGEFITALHPPTPALDGSSRADLLRDVAEL